VVKKRRRGAASYGCLITILVMAAIGYFGAKIGEVYWHYVEYKNIMNEQARFASHYTDEQIRNRLVAMADSLGLPEDASMVTIERQPHHILISADYVEAVELPLHVRHFSFSPRAEYDY
jgi:hypothetical protein